MESREHTTDPESIVLPIEMVTLTDMLARDGSPVTVAC